MLADSDSFANDVRHLIGRQDRAPAERIGGLGMTDPPDHERLRSLVQKGINPGTVLLLDGDVLRVHSRDESKVFVSGEVISPKALTMHNGRLTLNEALGDMVAEARAELDEATAGRGPQSL